MTNSHKNPVRSANVIHSAVRYNGISNTLTSSSTNSSIFAQLANKGNGGAGKNLTMFYQNRTVLVVGKGSAGKTLLVKNISRFCDVHVSLSFNCRGFFKRRGRGVARWFSSCIL